MNKRVTWEEFRNSGLLWWINRTLHLFGYAITLDVDDDGKVVDAYPTRCKFRGFSEEVETTGYERVTKYLKDNIEDLEGDLKC